MIRLIAVVATLLMLSATSLVTARFQSRQLFIVSDLLSTRARELDTDWRRLQLDRAELARNARIDRIARQNLKMINASSDRTIYIKGVPNSVAAPAAGPQASGARP